MVGCGTVEDPPIRPSLAITEVLAGDPAGFARADGPREFTFPRDHGSHPEFRTEWWYYTGHLATPDGAEFGFQLTFFRSALPQVDDPSESPSAWRPDDLWMAHFAVSDLEAGEFYPFERFARGAVGLAGASESGFDVWLEDWRAVAVDPDDPNSAVRLVARENGVELDLLVHPERAPVLQGVDGLSQKGAAPGNASYYYSVTRWQAAGTLTVAGHVAPVAGSAWLDREWSSSALEPGQVGWDWFSLQLDDGADLMLYVMRRADGSADPRSAGTWQSAAGEIERLDHTDFHVRSTASWQAPSGVTYPAAWRVEVPALDLELAVSPRLADQELRLAFRYWEGSVEVTGARAARALAGRGFAELTGYKVVEPR
jgi:predicted secreted hydrolase